jgi:hypothetical protein
MPFRNIRTLNAIQESRSPVKNEQRQADIDAMIASGTLPRGLVAHTSRTFESDGHTNKLRFNVEKNEYQLERTSKADGSVKTFNGTLENIAYLQKLELALLQFEANTLAQEAADSDFKNMEHDERQTRRWLDSIHGFEFSTIMHIEVNGKVPFDLMKAEAERQGLPLYDHLERIYCSIIDRARNNFDQYFVMRDARAAAAAAVLAIEAQPAKVESAATPFSNLRPATDARSTKEAANARTMDIRELRRKAIPQLSGVPAKTVPSTGRGRF